MNSSEGSVPAGKSRLTAGQVLSERREKLGLTVEECAETLKLSVSKIKAIEADNDAPFTSETFLRGYLKNYAKLVDLSADDVLYYFDAQRQVHVSDFADEKQETPRNTIKGLPYIVAIVVIVLWFTVSHQDDLLGDWVDNLTQPSTVSSFPNFQSSEADLSAAAEEVMTEEGVGNTNNGAPSASERINAELTGDAGEVEALLNSADERVEESLDQDINDEEAQEIQPSPASDSSGVNLINNRNELPTEFNLDPTSFQSPIDNSVVNTATIEDVASDRLLANGAVNAERAPTTTSDTTISNITISDNIDVESSLSVEPSLMNDLLHFTFLEACWVEVVDATNKKLVSSIRQANTELRVEGRSPFSIVLGNINGTTVRFNDDIVALVDSADGRTLRLTVGG